ncbi:hypothetical protein F4825DRAFT_450519 [Nemania diffusa]|nr:hypothetical protein F4825DRAFT_450519 [Nemania diffusa]
MAISRVLLLAEVVLTSEPRDAPMLPGARQTDADCSEISPLQTGGIDQISLVGVKAEANGVYEDRILNLLGNEDLNITQVLDKLPASSDALEEVLKRR